MSTLYTYIHTYPLNDPKDCLRSVSWKLTHTATLRLRRPEQVHSRHNVPIGGHVLQHCGIGLGEYQGEDSRDEDDGNIGPGFCGIEHCGENGSDSIGTQY